jgi:hypothetical protein
MNSPYELTYQDRNGERCASISPDELDEAALRKLVGDLVSGDLTGRPHVLIWYPEGGVDLVTEQNFDIDYRYADEAEVTA